MSETQALRHKILFNGVWDVDAPKPYPLNNKKHDKNSVAKLAATLRAQGQINPIVVDRDGVIIAGHGRQLAAKILGWTKIRVVQLDVGPEEARKLRLADNLATNTQFDWDALRADVAELKIAEPDIDVADLGFSAKEWATLSPEIAALNPNLAVLPENIEAAIATFAEEGEESMRAADEKETAIAKIFGFARVRPADAIKLGRFIATVKAEAAEPDPLKALIIWIEANDLI